MVGFLFARICFFSFSIQNGLTRRRFLKGFLRNSHTFAIDHTQTDSLLSYVILPFKIFHRAHFRNENDHISIFRPKTNNIYFSLQQHTPFCTSRHSEKIPPNTLVHIIRYRIYKVPLSVAVWLRTDREGFPF